MFTETIIWWPVFVAAAANMIISMLWYGPLFGARWMKETGMTDADAKKAKEKGMAKEMVIAFISSIVMAYVLAQVIILAAAFTAASAVMTAVWIWLGFMATLLLSGVLWRGESWALYVINAGHRLVALAAMALLMFSWI